MLNEFVMDPKRGKSADGFIPEIVESVGYGTETAPDPTTGKTGLVPLPTQVQWGEPGQERQVDNPACYAKIVKFSGEDQYVYYVRMNSRGEVSDPWGLYTDGLQNSRAASHRGTAEYSFRRVSEQTFLTFLRYLTTRNKSLLRICERSIKDGQ